ncbi:hypothetical protein FACS1894153_2600 [Bacteroidia bacterium]|nr:hypothetical protein FACS1894153_2600 [Bacteroidia bacterium]
MARTSVKISVDPDVEKAIKSTLANIIQGWIDEQSNFDALSDEKQADFVTKVIPYVLPRPDGINKKPSIEKQLEEWERLGYPEEFFNSPKNDNLKVNPTLIKPIKIVKYDNEEKPVVLSERKKRSIENKAKFSSGRKHKN